MDKQEMKKQILHRLMELKAEDQMNRFVFKELARENSSLRGRHKNKTHTKYEQLRQRHEKA